MHHVSLAPTYWNVPKMILESDIHSWKDICTRLSWKFICTHLSFSHEPSEISWGISNQQVLGVCVRFG